MTEGSEMGRGGAWSLMLKLSGATVQNFPSAKYPHKSTMIG